jgi:hypothetical protein
MRWKAIPRLLAASGGVPFKPRSHVAIRAFRDSRIVFEFELKSTRFATLRELRGGH